jgi:hypothetical protein
MPRITRRAGVTAGVLATALLAGGVVAVTTRSDGPTSTVTSLADVPPPSDGIITQTLTPSPSASPTPDATPAATVSPSAAASRTASPSATRPPDEQASVDRDTGDGLGPHPPGSVDFPYEPGRTTWDATSNGVHLRISMSARPKVGVPMTWRITTTSPDSDCCGVAMVFGDGRSTGQLSCEKLKSNGTVELTHTYNKAGRLDFLVQGVSNACKRNGQVYGTFDVAPGKTTKQGPALPAVKVDTSTPPPGHENDAHWVSLWGEAEDTDGWLRKLVVTWGDGTSQTFAGDANKCDDSYDGWPGHSYAFVPHEPPPAHQYKAPGSYTVTLTAYSSGCDGSAVQTGSAAFTWTIAAPETPAPSTS